MHNLANCVVDVCRPTGGTTPFGDPDGSVTVVLADLPVAINETTKRVSDGATQTPRTVRVYTGGAPAGTDIRKGDQLHDKATGRRYVVKDTTQGRSFGYVPDLELDLSRVGSGE